MRTRLKLAKLKSVLPQETLEALESEGFFDASGDVIVQRKGVVADQRELIDGERACVQYISTRSVDRDSEVLDPAGCISKQFVKAPQVLWGHDYSLPPIGKADWLKSDDRGIKAKTTFAETELAEEVWQLIKGGFLNTASVGFLPVERIWKGDSKWRSTCDKLNKKWGCDLEADGCQVITTKWVLLEYSMVPVPANIDALITAVAKGGLTLSEGLATRLGIDDVDQAPAAVIQIVGKSEPVPEPEPKRLIQAVTIPDSRFIEIVKSAEPVDRRAVAIVSETLAQLRGRV